MIKVFYCFLFLLCFLFVTQQQTELHARETVRVALSHYPPWMIDGKDKSGFDYELMSALAKHMGFRVEFVSGSFSENMSQLESGKIDLISSLLFRKERNEFIRYVSPPYKVNSIKRFYVRKGSGVKIDKYSDLSGLKVGQSRDAKYFPAFDLDDRMVKVLYRSSKESFVGLARGEVDAVICSDSVGGYSIHELSLEGKVEGSSFKFKPKIMPVYAGVSRKSMLAGKIDEIEAVMRYLQESGALDKMAEKYSVNLH